MCTSTLQVPSTQKKMHEKFNFSPRSSSFFFFKVMDTLNWVKILLKLHLQVLQLTYRKVASSNTSRLEAHVGFF